MCPNRRMGCRAEILCVESMSLLGLLIHRWNIVSSSLGGSRIPVSPQKTHSEWMATLWKLHLRVPLLSTFYFIHNLATPKTPGTLERQERTMSKRWGEGFCEVSLGPVPREHSSPINVVTSTVFYSVSSHGCWSLVLYSPRQWSWSTQKEIPQHNVHQTLGHWANTWQTQFREKIFILCHSSWDFSLQPAGSIVSWLSRGRRFL